MKKIMAILKAVWAYSLGHPFTWDVAAGCSAYLMATLGWFKPWAPGACIGYLLGRIWLLRREIKRLNH
jgi:hypothetical protein